LGGSWRLGGKAFAHQPTRAALEQAIACGSARRENIIDQRPGARPIAAAQMALGEPHRADDVSKAHSRILEPRERLAKFGDAFVDAAGSDFPVTANCPGPRGIARDGLERQRFVAALQSAFDVASLDVGPSHPRPADGLQAEVAELDSVLEPAPAVVKARPPLAEVIGGTAQMPERPAGPPAIAARLEAREGTLAGLDRVTRPAGDQVDLGKARPGEGI